ncbi:MAG: head GIN domain-containing protein [Pseudomonadota bacterium]
MTPRLTRRLGGMMLALSALAIVVPAAPALAAGGWGSEKVQGSGRLKTETRAIGRFNGVALALPGSVELRIGNSESVTIETDDNLLPLIETVVENGTLKIRASKRNLDLDSRRMKIVVQAKGVDHLALGGSGSIDADPLRGSKVMIDIGGSGNINVKGIDSETLSVTLGGSGDLKVGGGAARKLSVSVAGSGDVDMGRLQSVDASVNIAGSGDVKIAVRDQLSVTIAGSGDVHYYGDPKVSKTVVGSGSANKMGGAPR